MKPVTLDGIPDLFVHCFLHYHRLPWADLSPIEFKRRKHVSYIIGNQLLIQNLWANFRRFQELGVSIHTFFNRQIVVVNRQGNTNRCLIRDREFTNIPLFVINFKGKFLYGTPEIYAKNPIRMPLDNLCQFLQIPFTNLTFEDCPRNVDMFKVENGICFSDHESPGTSKNDKLIGFDGTDVYWIPTREIIKRRYFCTRNPGRCSVFFDKKSHLDDHEAICTVNTKITSKQVNLCDTLTLKNDSNYTVARTRKFRKDSRKTFCVLSNKLKFTLLA